MWQCVLCLLLSAPLMGDVSLDQMMSYHEMKQTGVHNLSYTQKTALEGWIDHNFRVKETASTEKDKQLYLSLNIEQGAKLEFSDGSTYEINPDDQLYTAYWITPFPVELSQSNNPDYPVKITNMKTGTSVSGRRVSTRQMLEEERKKAIEEPETLPFKQKTEKKPQTKVAPKPKTPAKKNTQPKDPKAQ